MAATHRLSRDHIVYSLDRHHRAALEIDSGDTVVFETWDARTGTIRCDADLLDCAHPDGANPATGPVQVRGAQPGDAVVVEISGIELAESGFLAVKAGQGLLASRADQYATRIVPVVDGMCHFGPDIRFPAHPMVGVVGTAPAGEGVSTGLAGAHGGNMDNRLLGEGCRVYLPVAVPGALLGLGDVHAAMGDGDITFIGLEICAVVTTRIELLPGRAPARPLIETPDAWATTAAADSLAAAARLAADGMVDLMCERLGLTFEDAYMLASAVVDVQICQCCEPGAFPVTARAVLPKAVLA